MTAETLVGMGPTEPQMRDPHEPNAGAVAVNVNRPGGSGDSVV